MLVFILACGLSVGLVAYSSLSLVFSEERQVARRLRHLSAFEASQASEFEPLLTPFYERVVKPSMRAIANVGSLFAPSSYRERLAVKLHRAGDPVELDVDRFVIIKALSGVTGGAVGTLLGLLLAWGFARGVLLGLILAVLGFYLPDLWLGERVSIRKLAIRRSLPDMLDMLMISVEAGLGFDAAVAKLVQRGSGPLAEEFGKMLQEVQAGLSRRVAFRHLADRTDVPELSAFIMAMVQADVFGISVTNVLRAQSHDMRLKRRQYAEETAQKAPAKMVFPLVLCILPATMIVLMGPAIISIGRMFGMLS